MKPSAPPALPVELDAEDQDNQEATSPDQVWYDKYKDLPYKDLAARMVELRKDSSVAELEMKALNKEYDVIRLRVVPERFAKDSLTSLRIEGVGRLTIANDAYCNTNAQFTPDLLIWLKDKGYGDLVKEGINPSTLKSLVKTMAQDDAELKASVEVDLGAVASGEEPAVVPEPTEFDEIQQFLSYKPYLKASVTKG